MRRIALLLLAASLLVAPAASAAPLTFQGRTTALLDAGTPIGFMFNVEQLIANGNTYTPAAGQPFASIYIFSDGSFEGWGNSTYAAAGQPNFNITGLVGVNPCYTTVATYGGPGDPTCDVAGILPYSTGWMYGSTPSPPAPLVPAGLPVNYDAGSLVWLDPAFETIASSTIPPPLEFPFGLFLRYSPSGGAVSYLTNDPTFTAPAPVPEPASALLLGLGFIGAASLARRRGRV